MELTVTIHKDSISIPLQNPFKIDLSSLEEKIRDTLLLNGIDPKDMDIGGLLSRMIRGVAGCEKGCPANALDLVQRGFKDFELSYIDGGILTARVSRNGKVIDFKIFPDF